MIFLNNSIKNTGGYRQQFAHVAGESAQGPGCSGEHWCGPHNGLKVKCPLIGACTWTWGSQVKVLSGEEMQPYWRKNIVGDSLEALELDFPSCFISVCFLCERHVISHLWTPVCKLPAPMLCPALVDSILHGIVEQNEHGLFLVLLITVFN